MAHSASPLPVLDGGTQVPDLLAGMPSARAVLDRHGLRGCGGSGGPPESLAFFARAHGVPLPSLLEELRAVARAPSAAAAAEPARPEDSIYRRFFRAGILVTLTAGAAWGAAILLRIAIGGGFQSVTVAEVNAHGHAQVVGWLGLFAMGFAYQAFPRFLGVGLPLPRLALATFPAMLAGIALRVTGEAVVGGRAGLVLGIAATALEVAAAIGFAVVVFRTTAAAGPRAEAFSRWVRPAAAWFVLAVAGEGALFVATATAGDAASLARRVATWQPALRDAEFHGFALLLVLGVAGRYLPAILGLPAPSAGTGRWLFRLALPIAPIGIAGWLGYRLLGERSLVIVSWAGGLLLVPVALLAATGYGVFRRAPERHRGLPFIRVAFAWLLVSALMLAATPFYARAMGVPFSHAWMGATRHAITVGFFSMMIVGVASKVVPTLAGTDPNRLPTLVPVFVLLNLGCLLRVSLQILTDGHPWAFRAVGVSGLLEVTALAIWGIQLLRVMAVRSAGDASAAPIGPEPAAGRAATVGPDSFVVDLIEGDPAVLELLAGRHGLAPLRSPAMRATLARGVTVRRAAAIAGVPVETLVDEIRAARG